MELHVSCPDRIGAALKALRTMHATDGKDKLGVRCLQAVIAELAAQGVAIEDLQPLADLEGLVTCPGAAVTKPGPAEVVRDRRFGGVPSTTLLARAAVVIDLLVKAGRDESAAAQAVMRLLMAAGVPAPRQGGDSRGWRRLLEFRNTLMQGGADDEARAEYHAFGHELDSVPAAERVSQALGESLWDRRRDSP